MGAVDRQPPTNTKTKLDLTKLIRGFLKSLIVDVANIRYNLGK